MATLNNPLLQFYLGHDESPCFDSIEASDCVPAIEAIIAENEDIVERVLASKEAPTYHDLIEPLESMDNRLHQVWSPISHLKSVKDSEALREVYEVCLQKLTAYSTKISQNTALCERIQQLKNSDHYDALLDTQKKLIDNMLRDFHRAGVDLPAEKKAEYEVLQNTLSKLSNQFEQNVLDATMAFTYQTDDKADLQGLPEHVIQAAAQKAKSSEKSGYLLTLDGPTYLAVLTYADRQSLRETFYQAYCTRASDQGPHAGEFDNSEVMVNTLKAREAKAKLLGFKHYADYSLDVKMAESVQKAKDFLRELAEKAKPFGESDFAALMQYAKDAHGIDELKPWDIAYYSEKQKAHLFDVDDEALRVYFPLPKVLEGLFSITEKLFDVTLSARENQPAVWHESVEYFDVIKNGEVIGGFFMDLYAREHKRGGAWMDDCRGRYKTEKTTQTPIAYLTCNFTPPAKDKTACLTHSEVETLFHEFGHGLHHLLTTVDELSISGISGVAWDAVELPSQFMENYCWRRDTLPLISEHVDSKAAIPDNMLDNLLAAKNFQTGLFLLRQIEFALFDLTLHTLPISGDFTAMDIQATLNDIRREVAVITPPSYNRFQCGFSHIFAGGYAAGYYSYLWADVLQADVFSAFVESGNVLSREMGHKYWQTILSKGGSLEALTLFKNFRGREPALEPLLVHYGLTEQSA